MAQGPWLRLRAVWTAAVVMIGLHRVECTTTPISIINLDRDTTRWAAVTQELVSKGVSPSSVTRLPAVYGKALSKSELSRDTSRIARLFCTPGMIGCYLSHRNFWRQTLEGDAPWQMVLEDDVLLAEGFSEKVEAAIEELQQAPETRDQWDVLLIGALGCVHPQGKYKLNRINAFVAGGGRVVRRVTAHCHIPRRPFGTHAYVLSRRGAEKLLRRASVATGHVDAVAWGIPELNLLCSDPLLAYQAMEAPSTIGAITSGVERWLPKFKVDEYTGITFEWAFNEPCIKLPILGSPVLTIGRCLTMGLLGFALGIVFFGQAPWLLPSHSALCVAMFVFLRIMIRPIGAMKDPASEVETPAPSQFHGTFNEAAGQVTGEATQPPMVQDQADPVAPQHLSSTPPCEVPS